MLYKPSLLSRSIGKCKVQNRLMGHPRHQIYQQAVVLLNLPMHAQCRYVYSHLNSLFLLYPNILYVLCNLTLVNRRELDPMTSLAVIKIVRKKRSSRPMPMTLRMKMKRIRAFLRSPQNIENPPLRRNRR